VEKRIKKMVIMGVVIIFCGTGCKTPGIPLDNRYEASLGKLQERVGYLESRNEELEARISELLEAEQRYAAYYRDTTGAISESLTAAAGSAATIEQRIDLLIEYNYRITQLVQRLENAELRFRSGNQGKK
jgi:exonuclease VII small subunit